MKMILNNRYFGKAKHFLIVIDIYILVFCNTRIHLILHLRYHRARTQVVISQLFFRHSIGIGICLHEISCTSS